MIFLYLTLTAVTITIQHFTFGRWWRRNELARRTMGHATILAISALFVPTGLINGQTVLMMGLATGVAGALTAAFRVHETETAKEKRVQALRLEVDHEQPPL